MHENVKFISPEPQNEQDGEAGNVIPLAPTSEVVPENVDVVLEPSLGRCEEPEAHHDEDALPVIAAEQEEPPNPSRSESLSQSQFLIPTTTCLELSDRDVRGGEDGHDHHIIYHRLNSELDRSKR